jgi:drug/metabolite transporter (DMT)-like permease
MARMTSILEPSPPPSSAPPRAGRLAAMALGVLAISTSSVLIRLAEAPALVVGGWRLVLAWLVLTPFGLPALRREAGRLDRRERTLLALSAVALAAHFGTWITSLSYTTVASSVILVTTTPIYVALLSWLLWREPIGRGRALAIAVAMVGSVVVSYGDLAVSGEALLGDLLAVAGALAMTAHLLIGRAIRRRLSTLAYVWPTYGLAGALLLGLCLVTGQPLAGYSIETYGVLLALAVIPQVLGHSVFNWALAHVSPLLITLSILGEPLGASVLAYLVLRESPSPAVWWGGPLILAGIVMASREEARLARRSPAVPPAVHATLGEENRP